MNDVERRRLGLRNILQNEYARYWLASIINLAQFNDYGPEDGQDTQHFLGRRSVALQILADIDQVDDEAWPKLQMEVRGIARAARREREQRFTSGSSEQQFAGLIRERYEESQSD